LKTVFLIGIAGDGVRLGPLGTAATNRPVVPTPVDYDEGEMGGMMIGRVNQSTRRKPAPVPLCPPQTQRAAWTRTRFHYFGCNDIAYCSKNIEDVSEFGLNLMFRLQGLVITWTNTSRFNFCVIMLVIKLPEELSKRRVGLYSA
jgi:hypothetical protein